MKFQLTLIFLLLSLFSFSQTFWPRDPYSIPSGNAKLGVTNKRSLNFVTDGQTRAIVDSNGLFRIRRLAGKGYRLVYVDSLGNLSARSGGGSGSSEDAYEYPGSCDSGTPFQYVPGYTDPFPCPSRPCLLNAAPWYEGGNLIGNSGNSSIGTCNNFDFILKTDGTNRLWIKTDGKVGVGESAPLAKFHVYESDALSSTSGTSKLLAAFTSNVNSNILRSNLWVVRDNNGSDWYGAKLHDGISIDGSFLTPGTNTKTWWERQPYMDEQSWGTGNQTYMKLKGSIFQVFSTMQVGSQSGAPNSSVINLNVAGGSTPTNAFEIFDQYTTKVNFRVKSNGEIYARYMKITVTNFPDYVFDDNYKLMSLSEIEAYYKKNHRLPEMPSSKEVEDEGLNVGEMNKLLVKKIEELTLLLVQQQKEINALKNK